MQNLHEQINAPHITTHKQAVAYLKHIDKMVKQGRRTDLHEQRNGVTRAVRTYCNHIGSKRTVAQNRRGK